MNLSLNFLKLAAARYSVRSFTDKPVSPEHMDFILKAASLAPTGCNNQPQKIYVLQSDEAIEKIRKCTKCHFNAPTVVLVCYDKNLCWTRKYDGQDCGYVDASIVTTHMMLEAAELGVGSTWVMYFDPQAVADEFSLPENYVPAALLVMGYPAKGAAPAPLHEQCRPIGDMVTYL